MNISTSGIAQEGEVQLGKLIGANMNSTADQAITLKASTVRITKILVTNVSTSLSLAVGGFYSAASKGGTAIVANTQVYSTLTGAGITLLATVAKEFIAASPIYFALTTAQGGAATADIYVFGVVLT